jgi:hypothetical protein
MVIGSASPSRKLKVGMTSSYFFEASGRVLVQQASDQGLIMNPVPASTATGDQDGPGSLPR